MAYEQAGFTKITEDYGYLVAVRGLSDNDPIKANDIFEKLTVDFVYSWQEMNSRISKSEGIYQKLISVKT